MVVADFSLRSTDDNSTQPKGCGYQKCNNNHICGANSRTIIPFPLDIPWKLLKAIYSVEKTIMQRVREIPPEKATEVLDFIEFISFRNSHHLMLQAQQDVVSKYWDDPKLDIYNA